MCTVEIEGMGEKYAEFMLQMTRLIGIFIIVCRSDVTQIFVYLILGC